MSYKPVDCKRDQFRKYIESKGVIDMLSKVLAKLLEAPVKPEHPIDFIRDNLGATLFEKNRIEQLEQIVKDYKHEVADLKSQIDNLQKKLNEKTSVEGDNLVPVTIEPPIAVEASVEVKTATPTATSLTDESAKKITDSEKAVAPTTADIDEVKLIESAVVTTITFESPSQIVSAEEPSSSKLVEEKIELSNGDKDEKASEAKVSVTTDAVETANA